MAARRMARIDDGGLVRRQRMAIGAAAARNHRKPFGATTDFQLETLFLDRELSQLRPLHEFDDLLNLFEVQSALVVS